MFGSVTLLRGALDNFQGYTVYGFRVLRFCNPASCGLKNNARELASVRGHKFGDLRRGDLRRFKEIEGVLRGSQNYEKEI